MATMNSLPGSGANSMRGSGSPVRRNEPMKYLVVLLPDGSTTIAHGWTWSQAERRAMDKVGSDYICTGSFTSRDLPGGERYDR